MTAPIIWKEITTEFKGRAISGAYVVKNGIVKVRTREGKKANKLGARMRFG